MLSCLFLPVIRGKMDLYAPRDINPTYIQGRIACFAPRYFVSSAKSGAEGIQQSAVRGMVSAPED